MLVLVAFGILTLLFAFFQKKLFNSVGHLDDSVQQLTAHCSIFFGVVISKSLHHYLMWNILNQTHLLDWNLCACRVETDFQRRNFSPNDSLFFFFEKKHLDLSTNYHNPLDVHSCAPARLEHYLFIYICE